MCIRDSYYTLLTAANAAVQAIRAVKAKEIEVAPLQSYFEAPKPAEKPTEKPEKRRKTA